MEEYVISDQYDGQQRKLYRYRCQRPNCGKWFQAPQHTTHKYCSRECYNIVRSNNKQVTIVHCNHCDRPIYKQNSHIRASKSNKFYCNRYCKEQAQTRDGELNYRQKAFYYNGKTCSVCGYDETETMLDVHHKDGDRTNNNIENLQVLCVWDHALITRNVYRHYLPPIIIKI